MEIINAYAPRKVAAPGFLATHQSLPVNLLVGDFNTHHTSQYEEKSTEFDSVLHASKKPADMLEEWTTKHQYILMN